MVKRRLAWLACAAAVLSGCAQEARVNSAGTSADVEKKATTEELVARSAEAMSRFLYGEKSTDAKQPVSVDAPAEQGAPREVRAGRRGAADAERAVEERSPSPAGAVVPAAPMAAAPSPAAAVPAPVAAASSGVAHAPGVAGFFSADSVAVVGKAASEAEALKAPALRIGVLALCSKVEAFGKFTRMESARLTGRPVAMLVYTQVDGFAHRTLGGAESVPGGDDGKTQWVVDLAQTVVVYRLSADGRGPDEQVLYVPEQPCRDVAVGKRRDHFLVQRLDLSPWLSAGKYAVKVTVRDRATGLVDERLTEIVLR